MELSACPYQFNFGIATPPPPPWVTGRNWGFGESSPISVKFLSSRATSFLLSILLERNFSLGEYFNFSAVSTWGKFDFFFPKEFLPATL